MRGCLFVRACVSVCVVEFRGVLQQRRSFDSASTRWMPARTVKGNEALKGRPIIKNRQVVEADEEVRTSCGDVSLCGERKRDI